eukprot:1591443-Karenia_brevis.AAC.1
MATSTARASTTARTDNADVQCFASLPACLPACPPAGLLSLSLPLSPSLPLSLSSSFLLLAR